MQGITVQGMAQLVATQRIGAAQGATPAQAKAGKAAQGTLDGYTQASVAGLAKAAATTRAAGYVPVAVGKCTLANAPANVHQWALACVANVAPGTQYATGAALARAAAPVHAKAVATAVRHCYRLTGQGVGKGRAHGLHSNTAQAWLAAYVLAQHVQPLAARLQAAQGTTVSA